MLLLLFFIFLLTTIPKLVTTFHCKYIHHGSSYGSYDIDGLYTIKDDKKYLKRMNTSSRTLESWFVVQASYENRCPLSFEEFVISLNNRVIHVQHSIPNEVLTNYFVKLLQQFLNSKKITNEKERLIRTKGLQTPYRHHRKRRPATVSHGEVQ